LKLLEVGLKVANVLQVDLDKATKEDIERLVETIVSNENYSAWTKQVHKVIIKKLYKWIKQTGDTYPEEVNWINAKMSKSDAIKLKGAGVIITEEEVLILLKHCDSSRNRAIITMLWDTGMRVGELLNTQISSVDFDERGYGWIIVNGKTGQRRLRLIFSSPYLRSWLDDHPCKGNDEAPLWINYASNFKSKNQAIKYSAVSKMLKDVFKKAGVDKPANPHNWRHSRATYVSDHLSDSQMCSQFGWTKGSNMLQVYNHSRDSSKAMEQMYGITEKDVKIAEAKPQICTRCKEINETTLDYCKRCNTALKMDVLLKENDSAKMSEQMQQAMVKQIEEQVMARLGVTATNIPEPQQVHPMAGMSASVSKSGTEVVMGDVQQFYPRVEYYNENPIEVEKLDGEHKLQLKRGIKNESKIN